MELPALINFAVFFLTLAGIYGVFSLGLNVQWGYSGQFNLGIAAFWAIGSYTSAILTTAPGGAHLGGFGLPFVVGLAAAVVLSAALAVLIGVVTVNLRTDYLAIGTIGIAEIVRLVLKNEAWLTNGVRGIPGIPRPFAELPGDLPALLFLMVVVVALLIVFLAIERLYGAPWGRVQRALRENELATQAAGKNVLRFRLEAFVLGAAVMGLGGALYAHFIAFISPEAFDPLITTFVVWVMLIAGGSGNNRGALLGAFVIWGIWSGTGFLTDLLPIEIQTRAGSVRILLIGALLQIILLSRPQGLIPEATAPASGKSANAAEPPRSE
jgi:branched-chain amino acid transport system permease protein